MVMTSFSHNSWFGSAITKCIKNVQPGIKIILNVVIGNKMLNLSQDHAKNNHES